MAYYLGFDAGGTRTDGVLANETSMLARVTGGSVKLLRVPPEQAEKNLRFVINTLFQKTGILPEQVRAVCIGIAGYTVPAVTDWVERTLVAILGGTQTLCIAGDVEIALDAAFPDAPGVLVIAGTGSNFLGRASTGATINVGGWGPMLGDEGSGYWIGSAAVRAALRARDRGEPTYLLDKICAHWACRDLNHLIEIAHAQPAPDFAGLAPVVAAAEEAGDATASAVLASAGRLLGQDALLVFRRVRASEPEGAPIPGIAYTGSILRHIMPVRQAMMDEIHRQQPALHIVPEAVDPLEGALWRARRCKPGSL
jgi:N-acetylglucosamine kinase-like BadF-type ATPase